MSAGRYDRCALNGRSRATLGEAIISGVPPFGLPKMSSCVGRISRPFRAASSLKSMRAKIVTPFVLAIDSRLSSVSYTE
jgi:hypothetical protein